MQRLAGRVAIVTGAGRGLGRSHALCLASHGASVVVNDLGVDIAGEGGDVSPANQVVRNIVESGGRAVASSHDIADWEQARELIDLAVSTFGDLHVLVNNAGILRDRTLANMSEAEWDQVIRVHLKGHAAPTRHAVAYWKQSAATSGAPVKASVIHTTSVAAFAGNFGQANYTAAKLGIIGLSRVVAVEAERFGVRSNCISPSARTRMSSAQRGADQYLAKPEPGQFDPWDPANVSPLVAWLAEEACPASSQIFQVIGKRILMLSMPQVVHAVESSGTWTLEELDRAIPPRLVPAANVEELLGVDLGLTAGVAPGRPERPKE
ncbi:MAG: SDR family NAD(P)-dependent oxidoreductase [Terriglobales bacterium]|jgi:NAD(P)-dependent dehydrogenase (short-subunit alcohol dehydrogenase family)